MKSNIIVLTDWIPHKNSCTIDIDWPRVHKQVSEQTFEKLKKRELDLDCQLVVEKKRDVIRLVAEFFNEQSYLDFKKSI